MGLGIPCGLRENNICSSTARAVGTADRDS
jgi:hypothetical protein